MRHVPKRFALTISALSIAALALSVTLGDFRSDDGARRASAGPSPFHVASAMPINNNVNPATGFNNNANGNLGSSDDLHYHGGPVQRTNTNYLIFWAPPTLPDGTPTQISPLYISLVERYFNDVGGSGLYNNNTQYYDTGGFILNSSSLGGVYIDTSPYPPSDCVDSVLPHGCLGEDDIAAEVSRVLGVTGWTVAIDHLFSVYLAPGEGECFPGSNTSNPDCFDTTWCAYHGSFTNNGKDVITAVLPYIGTYRYCSTVVPPAISLNGDLDADNVINATSHEQMESVTDPDVVLDYPAWLHQTAEIGDLCAWYFGNYWTLNGGYANEAWGPNGQDLYIIQTEWDQATESCVNAGP